MRSSSTIKKLSLINNHFGCFRAEYKSAINILIYVQFMKKWIFIWTLFWTYRSYIKILKNDLHQSAGNLGPPRLDGIKIFAILSPYGPAKKKKKKRSSSYILFLLQLLFHMPRPAKSGGYWDPRSKKIFWLQENFQPKSPLLSKIKFLSRITHY